MPFYPPLPEAQPANLAGNFLAGYGGVQAVQTQQAKNALAQMQMDKEVAAENALKQFGQTGGKEVTPEMWQVSPEAAMAAQKYVTGLGSDKRQALADNIKLFDARKYLYINDPDAYAKDYQKIDPDFQGSLMPPDKFAALTPEQRKSDLYQKEMLINTFKHPSVSLFDPQGKYIGESTGRPFQFRETSEEKRAGQKEIIDYREGKIRSRPTTEVDEDTGLPTGTQVGRVHYKKTKDSGKEIPVMTESQAKAAGTIPKGTKIIKETDPEYTAARHEAATSVNAGRFANLPDDKKLAKINELTDKIIQDRSKAKGGRQGQPGDAPPISTLQEGHQTRFKNGQVWGLQNGQPVRIQ